MSLAELCVALYAIAIASGAGDRDGVERATDTARGLGATEAQIADAVRFGAGAYPAPLCEEGEVYP